MRIRGFGFARPRDLSSDHRRAEPVIEPERPSKYLSLVPLSCRFTSLRSEQKASRRAEEGWKRYALRAASLLCISDRIEMLSQGAGGLLALNERMRA